MRLIKALIVLLIPALVLAQTPIFFSNGGIFGKIHGQTRLPMIVVDTVSITAGYGKLGLNKQIKTRVRNVVPTNKNNLYATITQVLDDTTKTVYYYGYAINDGGDTLTVKSNGGTADTGRVVIQIFMR